MSSLAQLVCLAVGAFAIGTESYVVAGLLPDLAGDLHVSVFALAYALGSPAVINWPSFGYATPSEVRG